MTIIYLMSIVLLGWNVLELFRPKLLLVEQIGLSVFAGLALHSLIYFVLVMYARILPLNSEWLILGLSLLLTMLSVLISRRHVQRIHVQKFQWRVGEYALLMLIVGVFGYIAIQNWYWPPHNPDGLYLYDFRAQRLLQHDLEGFLTGSGGSANAYPPFTSLVHYFFYQAGFQNPQNSYTLLLGAFMFSFYGYILRQTQSRTRALLGITLFITTPSIWWNSVITVTNIVFTEYVSLAVLYVYDKRSQVTDTTWYLAGFFLGMTNFIRQEPVWVPVLVGMGFYAVTQKKIRQYAVLTLMCVTVAASWGLLNAGGGSARHIIVESQSLIRSISTISSTLIGPVILALRGLWRSWNYLALLFVMSCCVSFIKNRQLSYLELMSIMIAGIPIIGIVGISARFAEWTTLEDAVYRMGTVAIPAFIASICLEYQSKRI